MTCLAAGSSDNTTFVTISLNMAAKTKTVSATYVVDTRISFTAIKDGMFAYLETVNTTTFILSKENRTACYVDVLAFDGVNPS